MHRIDYLGASSQTADLAIRFGDPDFIWQRKTSSVWIHFRCFSNFFSVHAQKRLYRSFLSKIWHRHSPRRPRFHTDKWISTTEWPLRDICDVCDLLRRTVARPYDLDPLTFWPWQCFIYSACHARRTWYQFLLSYDYRLLSYDILNLITFLLVVTVSAHAPCHAIYYRRNKNGPHFWNS